jgi:hypothetical protein
VTSDLDVEIDLVDLRLIRVQPRRRIRNRKAPVDHQSSVTTKPPAAIVAGVCVVEITVDVAVPQHSTFPTVAASQSAQPMIVDELAVHAANVIVAEFVFDPEAAADMSEAAMDFRAYPV